MRRFLIVAIIVGLGYFFLRQRQNEKSAATGKPVATQSVAGKPAPPLLTPAPRGQASEFNYMKRALDRARDVSEESRARTRADQNP